MFGKILVPVDLQDIEFSLNALKLALREIDDGATQLHLITVLPGFGNSYVSSFLGESEHKAVVKTVAQDLNDYAAKYVGAKIKPILKVIEGSAPEEINRYVAKAGIDLVILRAHQRSKLNEFLLGSVSARVVERACCSVMVLKN
ncbi:MAG: universal stress protein family protein [Osedax symbiont Rs2]|nr:MAG: universal stress protein family protein [Osedax symbiont Rs2]